jgi:predicted O-methyltransferase YrrM
MRRHIDLKAIFHSSALDREWLFVGERLASLFCVEDGTTGAVNAGDRRAIYYLTRYLQSKRVLEIGTHVGGSTLHFAAALLVAAGRLITVDIEDVNASEGPWRRAGLGRSPRQLVEALGFAADFVVSDSTTFLHQKAEASELFDLIFIDGDHSCEKVLAEIPAALRALAPGGIVLLHDYFPGAASCWSGSDPIRGPYEAVRRLQEEGVAIEVVPFAELPWPTKLGSSVTSLAALVVRD